MEKHNQDSLIFSLKIYKVILFHQIILAIA